MNIKNIRGFTIVEMLVIVPIVIVVIGVFITAIISMTGDVLATRASNALVYNIQDALNRIEQDVNLSGGFLEKNNITLTSPQGYDDATTDFKNANADTAIGDALILNAYTTTSNPLTSTRNLVYAYNPNACDSEQVSQNSPVMMNIVYFVKNGTLWRRVITPSNYATVGCSVPWQQPSCTPGVSGSFCKTKDTRLVDGITTGGFDVNYFMNPSTSTANSTASDSSQSDAARLVALQTTSTVSVTISATTTVAGRDESQTGTMRAVSPNDNHLATSIEGCPSGFITVPGDSVRYGTSDFCVMKYEAKNVGGVPVSQASGIPWSDIPQATAIAAARKVAGCTGCHLITEAEWLTIARNVLSVDSNWDNGAGVHTVGTGYIYSGHSDNSPPNELAVTNTNDDYSDTGNGSPSNQRRTLTLTNGEVIWDFAGNLWEWTQGTIAGGLQPGLVGDAGYNWREWTEALNWNGLPNSARPYYTDITVSDTWDSTKGIGMLYSNFNEGALHIHARGGFFSSNITFLHSGVFATTFDDHPDNGSTWATFRVAR